MLRLVLEPIELGQVVTVTVPAGIRAGSGAVVGRDHVFRMTRVKPPDYTVHVEGEGLIPVPGAARFNVPGVAGVAARVGLPETYTWMSLTGRVSIRYDLDRPMDRASVERCVREQLEQAERLSLHPDEGSRESGVVPGFVSPRYSFNPVYQGKVLLQSHLGQEYELGVGAFWLVDLASGEGRPVTGPLTDSYAAWLPDGSGLIVKAG